MTPALFNAATAGWLLRSALVAISDHRPWIAALFVALAVLNIAAASVILRSWRATA